MPTSLSGLIVFTVLLVPGFLHYVQRRQRVPQGSLSPLLEAATLTTVSLVTNTVALVAVGIIRLVLPRHSPEVRRLVLEGSTYAGPRLGYLLAWAAGTLALSSGLAVVLGMRPRPLEAIAERFAPAIVAVPAWYHVFDEGPPGAAVFVGCDLVDGSYVAGTLDWYSTDVKETGDRDLVLADPITYRPTGSDQGVTVAGVSRLVISARQVSRLFVSYVGPPPTAGPAERRLADAPVAGEGGLGAG